METSGWTWMRGGRERGGEHEREVGVMEKPGRDIGEGKQGDKEREKSYS